MNDFVRSWVYDFTTLLAVLDPVAVVPLFMAVTAGLNRQDSTRLAVYSVITALGVLVFFIAFGEILLRALHIPMASFQLAGSLLLLVFGMEMATGHFHGPVGEDSIGTSLFARSVYPLAMPGIASGAAILAVVVLTDNGTHSIREQASTTSVVVTCLLIDLLAMLGARHILKVLGTAGVKVITQVMGLILTSIAINGLVLAIKISFHLAL